MINEQTRSGSTYPSGSHAARLNYTWEHFDYLRKLIYSHTKIIAPDNMYDMYHGRLSACIRKRGLTDFGVYCSLLASGEPEVFEEFINALTTNLTSFFRELHHFDFLHWNLLPDLIERNAGSRQIRIWCAGCSTGEEPYSVAIVLHEVLQSQINSGWDIKVLATDIDSNVLDQCKMGLYPAERISGIPDSYLRTGFLDGKPDSDGLIQVTPHIQRLIQFKKLNLMEPWPMKGQFDFIFCRNVMIYFDRKTKINLISRYANALRPDGHLFVGHAESITHNPEFRLIANTIYKSQ